MAEPARPNRPSGMARAPARADLHNVVVSRVGLCIEHNVLPLGMEMSLYRASWAFVAVNHIVRSGCGMAGPPSELPSITRKQRVRFRTPDHQNMDHPRPLRAYRSLLR